VPAVPLIDLSVSDARVAEGLLAAYSNVGFAGLVNHGVDRALLDAIFEASAHFHELPEAEKRRIELNEHHRGYIPLGTSTDSASEYEEVVVPNASESFMMLGEASGGFLAGPNQWPEIEGFRAVVEAYHAAGRKQGRRVVQIVCRALEGTAGGMV
jgi:isopenicillin N synthase-like dioxygenase